VPPPLPPTEEVRPGLWSIGVPFPDNPLGYTLVYLLHADRGPVLVDAGWDDDESWDALVAGFRAAGSDVSDCQGVLVTHFHPDHHGLSGRVRDASDAWVAMHARDAETVARMTAVVGRSRGSSGPARDFADEIRSLLLDAGATEDELTAAPPGASRSRTDRPRPLVAPDRLVEDGERVDVPGWDLEAVWTPGHTPGHLCFHLPGERLLLSGDHVLPSITPHISISRSDRGGDPLGDFLDSLEKVAGLDAAEVLPAHRHRFADLAGRAHEIRRHHLDHLADIEGVLAGGPASLWQIAARLTWNRPWEQFPLGLRRAAVNETAAHLRYLARRGRAVRFKGVRPFTFGLAEHPPAAG
jgi:glyoxylase-like metal-dependent hydrolase (beta-lactamase superfamily II)